MLEDKSRRRFLVSSGLIGTGVLAGCAGIGPIGGDGGDDSMDDTPTESSMDDGMDGTDTPDDMMGDMDPAEAPRASIDRFSEAAGNLMVRTDENGLPGPDEPIDFDQVPFITRGLGPDGETVSYYNFDVQPTRPAPIYTFVRKNGTPVEGQLNVIGVIPGDDGYNDFWHVHMVTVPDDYEPNTVTSAGQLMDDDFSVTETDVIKNCPVVPDGSTARMRYGDADIGLVEGWYDDQVVSYFLFEEAQIMVSGGTVPISPIYVTFNNNPGEEGGGPPSGFMTESGSDQTHNVVATVPGDDGYSPLWLVNIYDNSDFGDVSDLSSATGAELVASGAATVNCPIVSHGMNG